MNRRDEQIAALENARIIDRQTLQMLQSELYEVRKIHYEEKEWYKVKLAALESENAAHVERINELNQSLSAEEILRDYSDLIRTSKQTNSQENVASLSLQLCKAMHKVEIMSKQMMMVERNRDNLISLLEERMSGIIKEKTKAEADLASLLTVLESEKQTMEADILARLGQKEMSSEKVSEDVTQYNHQTSSVCETEPETETESDTDTTMSGDDASVKVRALREQLDLVAREKDEMEKIHKHKMKEKEDTIILLGEVNEMNLEMMDKINSEQEFTRESKNIDSSKMLDQIDEEKDKVEAFCTIMNSIAEMTKGIENDILTSAAEKRKFILTLEEPEGASCFNVSSTYERQEVSKQKSLRLSTESTQHYGSSSPIMGSQSVQLVSPTAA